MTREVTIADVIYMCEAAIKQHQKALDKFQENMKTNPFYAFEWGDSAVDAAAGLTVATNLLGHCTMDMEGVTTEEERLARLTKYWEDDAERLCTSVSRSTSACHNQVTEARRMYTAKAVQVLKGKFLASLY